MLSGQSIDAPNWLQISRKQQVSFFKLLRHFVVTEAIVE